MKRFLTSILTVLCAIGALAQERRQAKVDAVK